MPQVAKEMGVRIDVPYCELTPKEQDIVLHGPMEKKHILYVPKNKDHVPNSISRITVRRTR
mgnify:CR=1 FL=1